VLPQQISHTGASHFSHQPGTKLVRVSQAGGTARQPNETTGSEVSWLYEVTIRPDGLHALRALIGEMADQAETNEPGTLTYHWTISEDGTTGHVHERYLNSEAALTHLASFNENFAARLTPLVGSAQMFVNGNPSTALRQEIASAQPTYMEDAGGFVREPQ